MNAAHTNQVAPRHPEPRLPSSSSISICSSSTTKSHRSRPLSDRDDGDSSRKRTEKEGPPEKVARIEFDQEEDCCASIRSEKSSKSGISFECHSTLVLEELSAMLDEQEEAEEEEDSANPQEDRHPKEQEPPKPHVVSFQRGLPPPNHRRSSNFSSGTGGGLSSAYSSNGDLSLASVAEDCPSDCGNSVASVNSGLSNISITRRYEARVVRRAISSGNAGGMFRSHSYAGGVGGIGNYRRNNSFLGRVVRSASGNRVVHTTDGGPAPSSANASPHSSSGAATNATFAPTRPLPPPTNRRHLADADAAAGLALPPPPPPGGLARRTTTGSIRRSHHQSAAVAGARVNNGNSNNSNPFRADMDGASFMRLLNGGSSSGQ